MGRPFFRRGCVELSKALLGRLLVRRLPDGSRLSGVIVEVEAYLGGEDKAAHSYQNRRTAKNASMFLDAGYSYIYKSYQGGNDCFNITSDTEGVPAAVLIRALAPVEGLETMMLLRNAASGQKKCNRFNICSGPGKLCQCLSITREELDGVDLTSLDSPLWLEEGQAILSAQGQASLAVLFQPDLGTDVDETHAQTATAGILIDERNIVATPRINIQYAAEWSHELLRFCMKDRKRYLSFPLGGTISTRNPCMPLVPMPPAPALATVPATPLDAQQEPDQAEERGDGC